MNIGQWTDRVCGTCVAAAGVLVSIKMKIGLWSESRADMVLISVAHRMSWSSARSRMSGLPSPPGKCVGSSGARISYPFAAEWSWSVVPLVVVAWQPQALSLAFRSPHVRAGVCMSTTLSRSAARSFDPGGW